MKVRKCTATSSAAAVACAWLGTSSPNVLTACPCWLDSWSQASAPNTSHRRLADTAAQRGQYGSRMPTGIVTHNAMVKARPALKGAKAKTTAPAMNRSPNRSQWEGLFILVAPVSACAPLKSNPASSRLASSAFLGKAPEATQRAAATARAPRAIHLRAVCAFLVAVLVPSVRSTLQPPCWTQSVAAGAKPARLAASNAGP